MGPEGGVLRLRTGLAATVTWALAALLLLAGACAVNASRRVSGLDGDLRAREPIALGIRSGRRLPWPRRERHHQGLHERQHPTPTVFADLRTDNFADRGIEGIASIRDFPPIRYVYVYYVHDAPIGGTAPVWGQPGQTYDDCPARRRPGPVELSQGCVVSSACPPARERRRADGP